MTQEEFNRLSMEADSGGEITRWLRAWQQGGNDALNRLIPEVYRELKRLAQREMRGSDPDEFQTTGLVHEAYLHLTKVNRIQWQDRAHFFAVAAKIMRGILVDAARARQSLKRGGQLRRAGPSSLIDVGDAAAVPAARGEEILAVHEALERLALIGPRQAQIVEMRFFGGLSVEETAGALKVSEQTVMRDWRLAKAWLRREMNGHKEDPPG